MKELRYADLGAEAEQRRWKAGVCPVEVGVWWREGIAKLAIWLPGELRLRRRGLRNNLKKISDEAVGAGHCICIRRISSR